MSFKEDEIVMCMVKRIEGTIIFVNIDGDGEGTIAMSEIAAGRIRNLREYVFPNKRIVCKVLSVDKDGHQHLSLRRVTGKEREEMQERYKKEKTLASILKTVSKSPQESIKLIREKYELWEFFDNLRQNPSIAEKFFDKKEAKKLVELLEEKEEREKKVKKICMILVCLI